MSQLLPIEIIRETLNWVSDLTDPRTRGWPLVGNPIPITSIVLTYVFVVTIYGPKAMRDKKPYQIKGIIRAYNILMTILNGVFLVLLMQNSYFHGNYSLLCTGIDYKPTNQSITLLRLCWMYTFVRIFEFLDTIFFLLCKKFSHISFLHVVHHAMVVMNAWLWLTFGVDGQAIMCISINCGVHVIMYTYYFLASFGESMRKYLWWKRYLTQIQIFQLFFFVIYASIPAFVECNYPKLLTALGSLQAVGILGLFCNFYFHCYIKPKTN